MKTLNLVTFCLIASMLGAATMNFAAKKGPRVGRGSHHLSRFQPWSPGWIRPEARIDAGSFRVEAL